MLLIVLMVLAHKAVHDRVIRTSTCWVALADDRTLDALTCRRIANLEWDVMDVLGWQVPVGDVYQMYADALFDVANGAAAQPRAAPDVLAE